MTRSLPVPGTPDKTADYNTSAHFLWVGDRTRQLDGEHVHYFRTIRNPMGVKVGPTMKDDELVSLLDIVNPDKEMGRVTLITRYGASKVRTSFFSFPLSLNVDPDWRSFAGAYQSCSKIWASRSLDL